MSEFNVGSTAYERGFTAAVGTIGLSVTGVGWAYDEMTSHLGEFLSPENTVPTLNLHVGRRQFEDAAHVNLATKEVVANWDPTRCLLSARTRWTARTALRLAKNRKISLVRQSQWRLLVRHALEHPTLAALEREGYVPIHSSTLVGPAGAVLLLGNNGAGKSTLAQHAIQELGLCLGSDNFTPTNGRYALGFPGPPKVKPGGAAMTMRPVPHQSHVRGLIALGWGLPLDEDARLRALVDFIQTQDENHRNTVWQKLIPPSQPSGDTDLRVARRLASLPFTSFDWRNDPGRRALDFIGGVLA